MRKSPRSEPGQTARDPAEPIPVIWCPSRPAAPASFRGERSSHVDSRWHIVFGIAFAIISRIGSCRACCNSPSETTGRQEQHPRLRGPVCAPGPKHGLRTMKRRKRNHQRALLARLTRHVEISLDCLRPRRIRTRSARYAAALGEMLGLITRPRCCVWCRRRGRLQRHHWDYAEPLNVTFLCPDCHSVADVMVARAQSA